MYELLGLLILFVIICPRASWQDEGLNSHLNSNPNSDLNSDLSSNLECLRRFVNCQNKEYKARTELYRNFWVLKNYIRAGHGPLACSSNVTYTTHVDYRYLDNVVPLLQRWRSPLSLAMYAPGEDLNTTLESILWLRQCHPDGHLVRELTTFHLYFNVEHLPRVVPTSKAVLRRRANYSAPPPYVNAKEHQMYRNKMHRDYPVNMGRNMARKASLTHFVLASDIELYPSPGLVPAYLHFYCQKVIGGPDLLLPPSPVVHVVRIFEVMANASIPSNKPELQQMGKGEAVPFHMEICEACHRGPKLEEWINATVSESKDLSVFNVGHRSEPFEIWEPIYIGTVEDPPYDDRLSWEGLRDKMTQAYTMCVLGYEFHILDNAF